jgi:5'-AMP-activated protein kinase catalytic alpha subunit
MVKKVGKYEIGKTLGEGTFGKVKYAVNTETGERVAIKVLDKEKIQKQNMGAQIKKEISIMKMVKHDYVVQLKEVLASRTKIFIVLELITGGELFDKIVAEGRFIEEQARFYFRQLIEGVAYCHAQGVCHRDLKPENLLLDENNNLKISDFGLSALYNGPGEEQQARGTLLHTTCGTPNYVAPEVLADKGYDGRAADIWSIGVILYVLLAGFLPFDEPTMSALFRKIQKAEFSYPSWFTAEVRALLDKVLVPKPGQRLKIEDIMSDPWYTNGASSKFDVATNSTALQVSEAAMNAAIAETTDGDDIGADEDKPKTMNAFDLINMCGGTALNRMLSFDNDTKSIKRYRQFTTTKAPDVLLPELQTKFKELQAENEVTGEVKLNTNAHIVNAVINSSKGAVGVKVQVFGLAPGLNLVEIKKGRGNIFAWGDWYPKVIDKLSPAF